MNPAASASFGKGHDVNMLDRFGRSPLFEARIHKDEASVQRLLFGTLLQFGYGN